MLRIAIGIVVGLLTTGLILVVLAVSCVQYHGNAMERAKVLADASRATAPAE